MKFKFLSKILIFLFHSSVKQVFSLKSSECSSTVTSNNVLYIGCQQNVGTESLTNVSTNSIKIFSFKGIPYAEPPLRSLRFQKPVPKTYSKPTTIKASYYRNPCMQPFPMDLPFPSGLPSEDCLYLNVFTPTLDVSANLSVMFWIHGGGFFFGSSSEFYLDYLTMSQVYDGLQLAIRNVIIVTINYRLGVFGFLYGNSSEAPGNVGLWDQAMALRWVKDNIKAFGGNPNDITMFGESAGSQSISTHIVSNITRYQFQKAIMQSGSCYAKSTLRDKEYSYRTARTFASNSTLLLTGSCNNDNDWIECLRRKDSAELLLAQLSAILWNRARPWYSAASQPFVPMFGDEFLPISVPEAVKSENFRNDIKILIGHNEMEGALFGLAFDIVRGLLGRYISFVPRPLFISKDIVYRDIVNVFINNNTIGGTIAKKYTETFPNNPLILNQRAIRRSAVHSLGDSFLTCPTVLFGGHIAKSSPLSGKVYQYRLTYANSQSISKYSIWANATHADDIPLVFGQPFRPIDRKLWSKDDRKLSKEIMNIWTHFAKYSELPKVNGNVWPAYGLNPDNSINASYIELHADNDRLGKVYVNRYTGNDGFNPPVIGDCFNFWDKIISGQFGLT